MAVMRSAMKREALRRWVKSSQEKAQRLLAHAEDLSKSVFSSSDSLISFLDLTARIHHYDVNNLLLIWEACPTASYLAGYKIWERQLPAGAQILKKEHIGKGIDIIAPFTDGSSTENSLVWYSVSVFDVSQIALPVSPPSFDSAYVYDAEHEYFLADAIKLVISIKFGKIISLEPPSQLMQEVDLPGEIREKYVIVRNDLSFPEQLRWLTEALAQLTVASVGLAPPSAQLLRCCIQYCLFHIWGLDSYAVPPRSSVQLKSVASREISFLHLLRDTVREINNLVASHYMQMRRERKEWDDLESDSPTASSR